MRNLIAGAVVGFGALSLSPAQAQTAGTIDHGKQVFEYWCSACHGAGRDRPGTNALRIKYNGAKPALLEERTDLPPEVLKPFVRTGIFTMPPFRKTEISDADLDALAAYIARKKR